MRSTFRPDIECNYRHEDGAMFKVEAGSISRTGNVMAITAHSRNDGDVGFGLTHRPSGMSITGKRLWEEKDISRLMTHARKFWKLLDDKQKRAWNSTDVDTIMAGTPDHVRLYFASAHKRDYPSTTVRLW